VRHLTALCCVLLLSACAEDYTVFHSQTGQPILLTRRGATTESCIRAVREEGARLGVTFRYIHIKGSFFGQSLLWPFEKGYACEAAIGPERVPTGIYPSSLYSAHLNSF
jgi:hypothetical protein